MNDTGVSFPIPFVKLEVGYTKVFHVTEIDFGQAAVENILTIHVKNVPRAISAGLLDWLGAVWLPIIFSVFIIIAFPPALAAITGVLVIEAFAPANVFDTVTIGVLNFAAFSTPCWVITGVFMADITMLETKAELIGHPHTFIIIPDW